MAKKSLRVGDYMTRKLVTVTDSMDIMRAVFTLVEKDLSGVPVLDAAGKLVGILTERDCVAVALNAGYFDEPGGYVADFMTSPVETVDINESLMDIAVRFRDSSYRRFMVTENDQLAGIITRRDVLRAMKRAAWFGKK